MYSSGSWAFSKENTGKSYQKQSTLYRRTVDSVVYTTNKSTNDIPTVKSESADCAVHLIYIYSNCIGQDRRQLVKIAN